MKGIMNPHQPNPPAFPKILRRVSALETGYGRALTVSRDVRGVMNTLLQLEKSHRRLQSCLKSFQKNPALVSAHFINNYVSDLQRVHEEICLWMVLYIQSGEPGFSFEEETSSWTKRKKEAQRSAAFTDQAAAMWPTLARGYSPVFCDTERLRKILALKQQSDAAPAHSSLRVICRNRLRGILYDAMAAAVVQGRGWIREKFRIAVYSYALQRDCRREREPNDFLSMTARRRKDSADDDDARTVGDWVRGYFPPPAGEVDRLHVLVSRGVGRELQRCEFLDQMQKFRRWSIAGVGIVLLGAVLWRSDVDLRLWETTSSLAQRIVTWSWFTIAPGEQEQFFTREIMNVNLEHGSSDVLAGVDRFIGEGLYARRGRHLFFAEHILKGYLVLLARGAADDFLQKRALEASDYLNPAIADSLRAITGLYQQETLNESDLRNQMLRMRREFIRRNVYLFMFLVVYEESPLIFIYPERINDRWVLGKDQLQPLGMDWRVYDTTTFKGAEALFVRGDRYPFKSAAGYFEGEFAVVFQSLSARADWTAWHELGHVVEALRFFKEKALAPVNVELNGMLFPLIFAEDPQAYVQGALVAAAKKQDGKDYYAQAAKGILNGSLIYHARRYHVDPEPLISNRFEIERIEKSRAIIASMSDDAVREMATALYRRPERYLATAEKGRYPGVETNVEELVYGAHVSPEGNVVTVGGGIRGTGGLGKGPKLIRDGENGGLAQGLQWGPFRTALGVFLLFEMSMVALHLLGKPIRDARMYGRPLKKMIGRIFQNAWGENGRSGVRAKSLPAALTASGDEVSEALRYDVEVFKMTAGYKEWALFALGVCLAPQLPKSSEIMKEYQRILFYLPFVGPFLARWPRLWPRQRAFAAREQFNRDLEQTASLLDGETSPADFFRRVQKVVAEYQRGPARHPQENREFFVLQDMERMVYAALEEDRKKILIISRSRLPEDHQDFEHLEKYTPGHDIREIDWNATARSVDNDVVVRIRQSDESRRVSFLLDTTSLSDEDMRRRWARELVWSLKTLGHNSRLENILVVLPHGQVLKQPVQWGLNDKYHHLAARIMRVVIRHCHSAAMARVPLAVEGLRFYDDDENRRYAARMTLIANRFHRHPMKLKPVALREQNIFLVGVKTGRRKDVARILGRQNRVFLWRERPAAAVATLLRQERE